MENVTLTMTREYFDNSVYKSVVQLQKEVLSLWKALIILCLVNIILASLFVFSLII